MRLEVPQSRFKTLLLLFPACIYQSKETVLLSFVHESKIIL